MNKRPRKIGLAMFVLCFVALAGCSNSEDSIDGGTLIDDVPREKFIGIVKECEGGSGLCDDGFYLEVDGGDDVLLNSVAFNLGGSDYLGNEVEISGVVNENGNDKTLDVESINVIQELEKEEEADWVGYDSSEFGFRIDYMSDWDQAELGNGVKFQFSAEDAVAAEVEVIEVDSGDFVELSSFADYKDGDDLAGLPEGYTLSKIGGSQVAAFKENNGSVYAVPSGGAFIKISLSLESEDEDVIAEAKNRFNEMLASFELYDFGAPTEVEESDSTIDEPEELPINEDEDPDVESEELPTNDDSQDKLPVEEEVVENPQSDDEEPESEDAVIEVSEGFSPYESLPYKFQGQYPKNWYYSGQRSEDSNVLHQYLFSDTPLDEGGDVAVTLDIYSSPLPGGSTMTLGGKDAVVVTKNGDVEVYVERTGSTSYRFTGDGDLLDVIKDMAASIED